MMEFLDWLAKAGGIIAIILTAIGFMFKEKWKQILQRSLTEDIERLKSDLVKAQAEHAASLAPQLEQIKHDFQQKLEAYKVSLIAESEGAKARTELRKNIALRFAEIEFERLVELEAIVVHLVPNLMGKAASQERFKSNEDGQEALDQIQQFIAASDKVALFISAEDYCELLNLRQHLTQITELFVGINKPRANLNHETAIAAAQETRSVQNKLRARLKVLAQV